MLEAGFAPFAAEISHLDYGGGAGLLSKLMGEKGFRSTSYDPFVNTDTDPATLGAFDLITAFEVFEHASDVNALMANLSALRKPNGIILFSTLASDGQIAPNTRLTWWYAAPRKRPYQPVHQGEPCAPRRALRLQLRQLHRQSARPVD
jgi:2-polyprenyl-3-methyl-5-hydroxy-6-metoxy-1,4-benzoquinol methylase